MRESCGGVLVVLFIIVQRHGKRCTLGLRLSHKQGKRRSAIVVHSIEPSLSLATYYVVRRETSRYNYLHQ